MDSLLQAMAVREARRQAIRAELKTLAPPKVARQADPAALRTALRTRLKKWQALARRGVAEARQVLRELLEERLTLTPVPCPAGWISRGPGRKPTRLYRFSAQLTLARLFEGLIGAYPNKVSPTGFEPVFPD